jgi:hypothetical protein
MQKASPRKACIDKSGLHAWQDPADFAHDDIAHGPALEGALDFDLLDHPLNQANRPRLKGRGLQEDLFGVWGELGHDWNLICLALVWMVFKSTFMN